MLQQPRSSDGDYALTAQQRAPGNESITQADLRADLFFLAGDAMRGRLTDTNENRATADYIRARFERAGLKPAAGNSLLPQLQPDDGDARRGQQPEFRDRCARLARPARASSRAARSSIRSASARAARVTARVVFAGFGIIAPKWNHDDYKDGVTRRHRDGARSRARRARSEESL